MSFKTFLFKNAENFRFDENGVGSLSSSEGKAEIDLIHKTAKIEYGEQSFELKNISFSMEMERPRIEDITISRILPPEDFIIKNPDVTISGTLNAKNY